MAEGHHYAYEFQSPRSASIVTDLEGQSVAVSRSPVGRESDLLSGILGYKCINTYTSSLFKGYTPKGLSGLPGVHT